MNNDKKDRKYWENVYREATKKRAKKAKGEAFMKRKRIVRCAICRNGVRRSQGVIYKGKRVCAKHAA